MWSHSAHTHLPTSSEFGRSMRNLLLLRLSFLGMLLSGVTFSADQIINLKNGLRIRGSVVPLSSIDQNAYQSAADVTVEAKPIWMIDDQLRRTYLHNRVMVVPPVNVAPAEAGEPMILEQPIANAGVRPVIAIGSILNISPFDKYGRRTFTMHSDKGPVTIQQGITELHSRYLKVQGLSSTRSRSWDMSLAPEALPSKKLVEILEHWVDRSTLEGRLKLIRFYIYAKRYSAARRELQQAINDYPNQRGLEKQLRSLVQQELTNILNEALMRIDAGQTEFAARMLNQFPSSSAIETRIKVQDAKKKMDDARSLARSLAKQLNDQVKQLPPALSQSLTKIVEEIRRDLKSETLIRLSDYQRLGTDETIKLENRIALAIGGWLLGPGTGEQNLAVAKSLVEVRRLVIEYLRETNPAKRSELLGKIQNQEGATALRVSRIIKTMRPPLSLPESNQDVEVPGLYRMTLPSRGGAGEVHYTIQLPPEYDPLRQYPCVVTLNRPGMPLEGQIAWWCGDYSEDFGMRMGEASRQGFIVIAPHWQTEGLTGYRFTPREHHRVLSSLRDAMRRTSIDPNRVFLSGHSIGGTAAWDIALSHPDIWSGVVPISADSAKYIKHYSDNGKYVPEYFVLGELAGYPVPLSRNGATLQRYLKPGYDSMVVAYKGRGEEDFIEEIDEIITWMKLSSHKRQLPPEKIETVTLRSGDQFFWWIELLDLKPAVNIKPFLWESAGHWRAGEIKATITADGEIQVGKLPADRCRVYLSPEMSPKIEKNLLSGETIRIKWGPRPPKRINYDGNLETMLEDVRTRSDRQRFYWATVTLP